jgi:hypothetical protein
MSTGNEATLIWFRLVPSSGLIARVDQTSLISVNLVARQ